MLNQGGARSLFVDWVASAVADRVVDEVEDEAHDTEAANRSRRAMEQCARETGVVAIEILPPPLTGGLCF